MTGLRFEADLQLTSQGRSVSVHDEGGVLVVTTDDWRADVRTLREVGVPARTNLAAVARHLESAGATVRIDSPAGAVISLGAGVQPGPLRRWFGAAPYRIGSARVLVAEVSWVRVFEWLLVPVGGVVLFVLTARRIARRQAEGPASVEPFV